MNVRTRARYVATGFDDRAPWARPTAARTLPAMDERVDLALDSDADWHVFDDRRLFHSLTAAGVDEPELSAFIDDRPAFDDLIDRALGLRP